MEAAADIEITKVEEIGVLACAVFERIALAEEDAKGLFSASALSAYSGAVGRAVSADQVQSTAQLLQDRNIIVRKGYGRYAITDPFIRQTWCNRVAVLAPTFHHKQS